MISYPLSVLCHFDFASLVFLEDHQFYRAYPLKIKKSSSFFPAWLNGKIYQDWWAAHQLYMVSYKKTTEQIINIYSVSYRNITHKACNPIQTFL